MNIISDMHMHTVASTHAYGTLSEMAAAAEKAGLLAIAITDHGPALPDSPHIWHFDNMKVIPREIGSVKILRGIEANVLGPDGKIDIEHFTFSMLDWVIASMHTPVFEPMDEEAHTDAWLSVIDNPWVDVLGHTGDGRFPFDYDRVIAKAARAGKLIEINSASFALRKGSISNCRTIAQKCMQYGAKIVVNSDAHTPWTVGRFERALEVLEDIAFPCELVVNSSVERLMAYLNNRPSERRIEW